MKSHQIQSTCKNLGKEKVFLYSQNFKHQMYGFATPNNFPGLCRHQLNAPQFNSRLKLTTWSQHRSHRPQSHKTTLHCRCQSPVVVPRVPQTSSRLGYKSGVPMTPTSDLIICYTGSQNSGKCFTSYCQLL